MKTSTKLYTWIIGFFIISFITWNLLPVFIEKNINDTLPQDFVIDESSQESIESTTTVISEWSFQSSKDVSTSWTARIISNGERNILELNNLQTENGPDLFIYLSQRENISDESDVKWALRLTKLKWNSGNQVYEIPEEIDISKYNSLAIHCRAYNHLFWSVSLK